MFRMFRVLELDVGMNTVVTNKNFPPAWVVNFATINIVCQKLPEGVDATGPVSDCVRCLAYVAPHIRGATELVVSGAPMPFLRAIVDQLCAHCPQMSTVTVRTDAPVQGDGHLQWMSSFKGLRSLTLRGEFDVDFGAVSRAVPHLTTLCCIDCVNCTGIERMEMRSLLKFMCGTLSVPPPTSIQTQRGWILPRLNDLDIDVHASSLTRLAPWLSAAGPSTLTSLRVRSVIGENDSAAADLTLMEAVGDSALANLRSLSWGCDTEDNQRIVPRSVVDALTCLQHLTQLFMPTTEIGRQSVFSSLRDLSTGSMEVDTMRHLRSTCPHLTALTAGGCFKQSPGGGADDDVAFPLPPRMVFLVGTPSALALPFDDASCGRLTEFGMYMFSQVPDETDGLIVDHLSSLRSLVTLRMSHFPRSMSEGVQRLATVKHVMLHREIVADHIVTTDEAIDVFARMPGVESVALHRVTVDEVTLMRLAEKQGLRVIRVVRCRGVDAAALERVERGSVGSGLRVLTEL